MERYRTRILLLLAAGLVLASCATTAQRVPTAVADVPRITASELRRILDAGEDVTVVDTRSLAAFEASHIPGAVWIAAEQIEARHGELAKGAKIVTYCT